MVTRDLTKVSFKAQMLQAREDAIIQTVNRLLCEKGFEAMTVDQVAADVGIAKASLYKHFPSKEDLAAAATVWVLRQAQAFLDTLPADAAPMDQLRAVVAWTMGLKLAGEMPALPSQNSSLRASLMGNPDCVDAMMDLSKRLGAWIEVAQSQGALNPRFPATLVLYTLFARACDPVLEFLKLGEQYSHEEIIALVLGTCFEGLSARPVAAGNWPNKVPAPPRENKPGAGKVWCRDATAHLWDDTP